MRTPAGLHTSLDDPCRVCVRRMDYYRLFWQNLYQFFKKLYTCLELKYERLEMRYVLYRYGEKDLSKVFRYLRKMAVRDLAYFKKRLDDEIKKIEKDRNEL